jgi:2'-5' RNA ligase
MTTLPIKPVRVFVAIRPNDAAQAGLVCVQRELKKILASTGLRIQWTDPETFHITLLFLGDISPVSVEEVSRRLEKTAQKFPEIGTSLTGPGLFKKSGAVWVGIDVPPPLFELQKEIAAVLDMEPGRFHAHVTLGRIKAGRADQKFFKRLEKINVEPVSFGVVAIELVKSELLPDGARHTVLGSFPLRPAL